MSYGYAQYQGFMLQQSTGIYASTCIATIFHTCCYTKIINKLILYAVLEISRPLTTFQPISTFGQSKSILVGQIFYVCRNKTNYSGSHKMPAKWSYKRWQQAAAAVQAKWNKNFYGTNKATVIIIILLYACIGLAITEQEHNLHHSNNNTCTQVHNTTGIKMI